MKLLNCCNSANLILFFQILSACRLYPTFWKSQSLWCLEVWFAFWREPLLDIIEHKQISFYRYHIPGLACSQHIYCPMYMAILYVLVAFQLFAKTINSQELYMHHAIFIVGLAVRLWELDNLVRKMPQWPLTSDVVQSVPIFLQNWLLLVILLSFKDVGKKMTFHIVFTNRVCNESSHLRHEIQFGKSPAKTPGTGLWIRQCCASLTLCLLVSQEISSPALNLFTLCRALDKKNGKTWIPRNGKLWDVADVFWDLEDLWKNWFILESASKYFPTTEKLLEKL